MASSSVIAGKLALIQQKLKAPKGQYNSFGGYKYRSCEDILEALKPLLAEQDAGLTLTDELVAIGNRYYVKATASLFDLESGDTISNTAYAREDESKKGMDGSQITGTASSYARKYCLNGLLLIDDTKDADTDEYAKQTKADAKDKPAATQPAAKPAFKGGIDIKQVKDDLKIVDDADSVRMYYAEYLQKHPKLSEGQTKLLSDICQQRIKKIEEEK